MKTADKTWLSTNIPNLLKNAASGRYYGRFTISGKQKWVNLKTGVWSVAKIRLADERSKIERTRKAIANVGAGGASVGELVSIYRGCVDDRTDLKAKTKVGFLDTMDTVLKTWPRFTELSPDKVTREAVIEWRNRVSREGTGYAPPGANKGGPKLFGRSSSTINHCVDAIRHVLDIAVDQGQLHANPLQRRGIKVKSTPRKPKLPDSAMLGAIFDEIERGSGPGAAGLEIADFCRFLAYTGCRLSEARGVTWGDVDFTRGLIFVRGTKTESANREVPMIPAVGVLLEKMRDRRQATASKAVDGVSPVDLASGVLGVGEAGKSLVRACGKLGAPVLTHHDLRDAFATTAIEAGVDVPTVAAWLGHADGGALLMKVYAHHRRPHSLAQAAKIQIGINRDEVATA